MPEKRRRSWPETPISDEMIGLGQEMDIDADQNEEAPSSEISQSIPSFIDTIMDSAEINGDLGILIAAVHAAFLKSGFVFCNDDDDDGWSPLRKYSSSLAAASAVSIHYTLPELLARVQERDEGAGIATVKFSVLKNQVVIYGSVVGEPFIYRLHFDLSKVLPLFAEEEVFDFEKTVVDGLCQRLLVDLRCKSWLPPPSFHELPPLPEKSFLVPRFLERIMESEKERINGHLGRPLRRLIVAVHAIFLEFGFIVWNNGDRSPELLSVQYTVPELRVAREGVVATLRFLAMRNHFLVYGSVGGEPDVYRLHLDLAEVLPLLAFPSDELRGDKENLGFWRTVKDRLCLPLMIDICHKNGLPLPPCFAALSSDLKLKVLKLLPGADIVKIACTGSEIRDLMSDEELWKQKFFEEFGQGLNIMLATARTWKEKFKQCWLARKEAMAKRERQEMLMRILMQPSYLPRPALWIPDYGFFP